LAGKAGKIDASSDYPGMERNNLPSNRTLTKKEKRSGGSETINDLRKREEERAS